jgi:zinc protease
LHQAQIDILYLFFICLNLFYMRILFVWLLAFACTATFAQTSTKPLPLNPDVRTGVLPNGLTYYVMKNKKPENRAELRLVVKASRALRTW